MPAPTPTDAQLVELFDRLWHDPRRRDDRAEFFECEHCARPVRWIANLASRHGSSLPIVARPVTTAACFDHEEYQGLVAVYVDRTGFTLSRFTTHDDVEDAFLYRCHWDVCDDARAMRDRLHRERFGAHPHDGSGSDPEVVRRYAAWRQGRQEL